MLGLTLYWSWSYATRGRLLADDVPAEIHPALIRRIVIAQSLYAVGAALCFLNTYYSIAAIVLVAGAGELCHRSKILLGTVFAEEKDEYDSDRTVRADRTGKVRFQRLRNNSQMRGVSVESGPLGPRTPREISVGFRPWGYFQRPDRELIRSTMLVAPQP